MIKGDIHLRNSDIDYQMTSSLVGDVNILTIVFYFRDKVSFEFHLWVKAQTLTFNAK